MHVTSPAQVFYKKELKRLKRNCGVPLLGLAKYIYYFLFDH